MFRLCGICLFWIVLSSRAAAEIGGGQQQTIDFTQPEQAARLATWSDQEHLGCTAQGFGWDADKLTSRDGWIETEPLAIGTSWRPTSSAAIRIKVQTNYPMIEETSPGAKTFWAPGIHVRHSPDRVHWSDWQPTELAEDPRAPGSVLYTAQVGVPRRARRAYDDRRLEWSRREDIDWGSDELEFCRSLVKEGPDYFAKQRPFVGYVQFLLEDSFRGGQRLTRFEADVRWWVSGIHQFPNTPAGERRQQSHEAWSFRGDSKGDAVLK